MTSLSERCSAYLRFRELVASRREPHASFVSRGSSRRRTQSVTLFTDVSSASTASAATNLRDGPTSDDIDEQAAIAKHEAGEFDWILSIPSDEAEGQAGRNSKDPRSNAVVLRYGCNLIAQGKHTSQLGDEHGLLDIYTLLATSLTPAKKSGLQHKGSDEISSVSSSDTKPARRELRLPFAPVHFTEADKITEITEPESSVSSGEPSPGPAEPRLPVTDKARRRATRSLDQGMPEGSASFDFGCEPKLLRGSVSTVPSRAQHRSSTTEDPDNLETSGPLRTSYVTGLSSLPPPKTVVRSGKVPLKPAFTLPGEAVAKRLKEQREARRLARESAENLASAVSQQRRLSMSPAKSSFELPGEAISRRKREQREKELKEQEQMERRRRQFRAAPIRSAVKPASYPRETAASRARRVKNSSQDSEGHANQSSARAALQKSSKTVSAYPTDATNGRKICDK